MTVAFDDDDIEPFTKELDLSMDNVIVVDNLPIVPPEKVDKLQGGDILLLSSVHSIYVVPKPGLSPCQLSDWRRVDPEQPVLMTTKSDMLFS